MPTTSKPTKRIGKAHSQQRGDRHGDQKLIEVIQAAINELKVPESCEGKMRGEYVKCGMRLAIEAINAAIEKHKSSAASNPASGLADDVISDEVESLLINVAQILDVVKTEWAEAWSAFDQEQRDHITKLLMAKRPPNE